MKSKPKSKPKPKGKLCSKCKKHTRAAGMRFCGWCANVTIREMNTTGYLTQVPGKRSAVADV